MNLQQAKSLRPGDILHYTGDYPCERRVGPRGGVTVKIIQARVTGMVRTWKTRPDHVMVPIKHGMYDSGYLTHENMDKFHLAANCPLQRNREADRDPSEILVDYACPDGN